MSTNNWAILLAGKLLAEHEAFMKFSMIKADVIIPKSAYLVKNGAFCDFMQVSCAINVLLCKNVTI